MSDIVIQKQGFAGRITLNRPKALNALSYQMCLEIEAALDTWREDDAVKLVIIDANGDKAFCAGGDIQEMYDTGMAGDFDYGRRFWADEYRLNDKIAEYPKPYIAFMQGFTMGGGVGVSCHGSHRIVCETSKIAMPECGIGLVPDVGGSLLLARAPGNVGEYLGTTGHRMVAGDAIYAGFADHFVSYGRWPALIDQLCASGDADLVRIFASSEVAPDAPLKSHRQWIDQYFALDTHNAIIEALRSAPDEENAALTAFERNSPLSMACCVEMLTALRANNSGIREALSQEYRFTWRSLDKGDFLEGIRAAIIDKDRNPRWKHQLGEVTQDETRAMLAPLGENEINWEAVI